MLLKRVMLAVGFLFRYWLRGEGPCPRPPTLYFFRLVYLFSIYGFVFGPTPSCGLLDFFLLCGSLQTQEVNVFSSNTFEDLELVGFALRL
jgi:hypothetical protein